MYETIVRESRKIYDFLQHLELKHKKSYTLLEKEQMRLPWGKVTSISEIRETLTKIITTPSIDSVIEDILKQYKYSEQMDLNRAQALNVIVCNAPIQLIKASNPDIFTLLLIHNETKELFEEMMSKNKQGVRTPRRKHIKKRFRCSNRKI
jgi:hypothetical protein